MRRFRRENDQSNQASRLGAALVEMAVVMPVFVLFLLGTIELGRAMMLSQLITNAARDGARVAAAEGSTNGTVEAAVEDFLSEAMGLDADDITVEISVTAGPGNPDPGDDVEDALQGDKCVIKVSVPFDRVTLTKPKWLSDKNLTGFCAMRREW